jgi:hypothetical protein
VAAPHRDDASPRPEAPDALGPASTRARFLLGVVVLVTTVLAVVLGAGGAPVGLRGPAVLATATLLPGYPLVVRLRVDLASLLALDVCASLAIDAAGSFLLVQTRFWHPLGLALVLVGVGAGSTLLAVTHLRRTLAQGPP